MINVERHRDDLSTAAALPAGAGDAARETGDCKTDEYESFDDALAARYRRVSLLTLDLVEEAAQCAKAHKHDQCAKAHKHDQCAKAHKNNQSAKAQPHNETGAFERKLAAMSRAVWAHQVIERMRRHHERGADYRDMPARRRRISQDAPSANSCAIAGEAAPASFYFSSFRSLGDMRGDFHVSDPALQSWGADEQTDFEKPQPAPKPEAIALRARTAVCAEPLQPRIVKPLHGPAPECGPCVGGKAYDGVRPEVIYSEGCPLRHASYSALKQPAGAGDSLETNQMPEMMFQPP